MWFIFFVMCLPVERASWDVCINVCGICGCSTQALEDEASKLFVLRSRSAQEVCIVDTSVYSCNRCFRILYNSKLGKQHALLPLCGCAAGTHPALHLLESLASCVPVAVELVPQNFGLQSPRQSVRGSHALSMPDVGISDLGDGQHLDVRIGGRSLVWKHLSDAWDITRRKHEHVSGMKACRIRQAVQVGTQFVVITLCDNRFCLCKGASHKSNNVYLVVDLSRLVFHQRCYDTADCLHFRSQDFPVPSSVCGGADLRAMPLTSCQSPAPALNNQKRTVSSDAYTPDKVQRRLRL